MADCNCGDRETHARAVEDAVFRCLSNANANPSQEAGWLAQADKLERKFTTGHGLHYSLCIARPTPEAKERTDGR